MPLLSGLLMSPPDNAAARFRVQTLDAAWEAEGDSRGLERMTAAFWDAGTTWIDEQLGGKT